jgi:O-methyltransferase involved in polyketide biosynthesis
MRVYQNMSKEPSNQELSNQELSNHATEIIKHKDLSVTALYTAHCWYFAKFKYAEFFISDQSKAVFDATNFVMRMARLFRRDFIDLPKGLSQRHQLIDLLLANLINSDSISNSINPQQKNICVIEVACGLSQRGSDFRINHQIPYFEVDLPHVIQHKKICIQKLNASLNQENDALQIKASQINFNDENHFLISADLKENWSFLEEINQKISNQSNQNDLVEYVIIAEGLWMYLDEKGQRDFLTQIQDFGKITLIFDLVPKIEQPKPGLMGRLLGQLMRKFTKDSFVEHAQNRAELIQMLKDFSFKNVELLDCHLVAHQYQLPFADAKTQQLIFKSNNHQTNHDQ